MEARISQAEVLKKLVMWGAGDSFIRAMVLTSSRARQDGSVDSLSDFDVVLGVADVKRFEQEDDWLSRYGRPLVHWRDQGQKYGFTTCFCGVLYADYTKIDYSIWPDALLLRISTAAILPDNLDVGYRVLLDKDGRTSEWKPPSYTAHIPLKPTEAEYHALIEAFWWETTYVAKNLRRDELLFAKLCLDYEIKLNILRRLLEWRIEIEHNWRLRPGVGGRGFKRFLPGNVWSELARSYVGSGLEENWNALFLTVSLFRQIAREIADALVYTYPQQMDDEITAYLRAIQKTSLHQA